MKKKDHIRARKLPRELLMAGSIPLSGQLDAFVAANEAHLIAGYLTENPNARQKVVALERMKMLAGILMTLSLALNIHQVLNPPVPQAVLTETDAGHSLVAVQTTSAPFNTLPVVSAWTKIAVAQALTIDFSTYTEQFAKSRPNFTASGWEGFMNALKSDDMLNQILTKKLRVESVATGPAILSTLHSNDMEWDFEIPITTTYSIGQTVNSSSHLVKVKVVRVNPDLTPLGRGIESISLE